MAVKGTFHIDSVSSPSDSQVTVSVSINGHETDNLVESGSSFTVALNTGALMKSAVNQLVQAWLEANHSYSFTPAVDTVEEL
jgi:hypothetical protein